MDYAAELLEQTMVSFKSPTKWLLNTGHFARAFKGSTPLLTYRRASRKR